MQDFKIGTLITGGRAGYILCYINFIHYILDIFNGDQINKLLELNYVVRLNTKTK